MRKAISAVACAMLACLACESAARAQARTPVCRMGGEMRWSLVGQFDVIQTQLNGKNVRVPRLVPGIIRFLGYCPYTPGLSFPARLKLIRRSLGFLQKSMANNIGIDESTWRG